MKLLRERLIGWIKSQKDELDREKRGNMKERKNKHKFTSEAKKRKFLPMFLRKRN